MSGAVSALRNGGRLVLIGYQPGTDFSAATPEIVFREIEVYSSHWASLTELREVIDMIAKGTIDPIIMRQLPLERATEALDLLSSGAGAGRTVLRF